MTLNTDWIKRMDNHKLHLGIDGTLSFLKSTVNTENVVTGEKGYNTTRYPDGGNSMHTVEAFATHVWNISQKLSMHDGIRLGYATTYSSVKDTEQFPFFGGGSQRKNNLTYSAAIGLNYLPSKTWKTAFSMSTAYRVPNIDNTSKVFDSKVGTVTIPNKHIRPEKTVSADLNITKHVADVLTWENVVYATYYFDAITTARGTFMGGSQMEYQGSCATSIHTPTPRPPCSGAHRQALRPSPRGRPSFTHRLTTPTAASSAAVRGSRSTTYRPYTDAWEPPG